MWDFFQPVLEFDNPVKYAIPFFILLIVLEAYWTFKIQGQDYHLAEASASIGMGLGSVFADLCAKALAFLAFTWAFNAGGWFKDNLSFTLLGWILLFVLDDLSFYWHHRLSHQIRLLWAAHVHHHSSEDYNLATALRQSWTEVFHKYWFFLWLPLLGFHPLMVLTQMSINLIYQFWIHTQNIKRLPSWFEFFFNTPSHHRVHHGSNVAYLDKNHGGTLILWDRIFGTFQAELDEEPVRFGITTNIKTRNLLKIASHEYLALWQDLKQAPNLKTAFQYLLKPPGWRHDGQGLTTKDLQKNQTLSNEIDPNVSIKNQA